MVSLTVIPLLCYIMLGIDSKKEALGLGNPDGSVKYKSNAITRALGIFDRGFEAFTEFYRQILEYAVDNRKKAVAAALIIFTGSLTLIPFMGAEFIPQADEGKMNIAIEMPRYRPGETDRVVRKVEKYLMGNQDMNKISAVTGAASGMGVSSANAASITVVLIDQNDRKNSTADVAEQIRRFAADIAGCDINVTQTQSMGMGTSSQAGVSLNIYGDDMDELREISADIERIMTGVEGVRGIKSSISDGSPELQIEVDKAKAASME